MTFEIRSVIDKLLVRHAHDWRTLFGFDYYVVGRARSILLEDNQC